MYGRAVICPIVCFLVSFAIVGQPVAPKSDVSQTTSQAAAVALNQQTYDVSTFRDSKSENGNKSVYTHFNTLSATNWPLTDILQEAFGIQQRLIVGLPGWAQKARYDVNAKVTNPDMAAMKKLTPEQWNGMLRSLCEQRLRLKWHLEVRPEPVYELAVAKGGSKLRTAGGPSTDFGVSMGNSNLVATSIPTSTLAKLLSKALERPVVDQTKLTGVYDFHLKWTPDQTEPPAEAGQDPDLPSLFTALQEQLGLRLRTGKDPVQVLVIDGITPPTEN